jgi:radical SAM protein with 4Fe4S-binding SPASM domain
MDKFRIDSTKIQFHPARVAQLLDGKDDWNKAKDIYPLYVEVSPVGACNHRCTFCAVDYLGYKTTRLDLAVLDNALLDMAQCGVKSILFAGEGEPLLHKRINDIVFNTINAGLDVAFTTNGVMLNKLDPIDKIKWIRVSLNAGTRDTYAKVHRTKPEDFDRVLANLADAVLRKGDCSISAQMVLLPENAHEVETLKQIGNDIGLDFVSIKPYSQHKKSLTHLYEHAQVEPPADSAGLIVRHAGFETKEIGYHKCNATPFLWGYLMSTGDLYSCSAYLLDDRFNLGNINRQTFREIWHGDKRKANWEYVRKELDIKDCRVNCRMDKANVYLDELINGKVPSVNFI